MNSTVIKEKKLYLAVIDLNKATSIKVLIYTHHFLTVFGEDYIVYSIHQLDLSTQSVKIEKLDDFGRNVIREVGEE